RGALLRGGLPTDLLPTPSHAAQSNTRSITRQAVPLVRIASSERMGPGRSSAGLHPISTCAQGSLASGPGYPSWHVPRGTADADAKGVRDVESGDGRQRPDTAGEEGLRPEDLRRVLSTRW